MGRRKWTQEEHERRSGQKRSAETRARMSYAKTGLPRDDATKQKISEGKLKYKFSPEHLQHIRDGNVAKYDKVCIHCNKIYIGKKNQKFCCKECGLIHRIENAKQLREKSL